MRAYKTVNDAYVEPISFTVPRRAETFQADIFPPAVGAKPAVSADEWLQGKTGVPAKLDFESIYEGGAPKEIASDYKPPPKVEPVPTTVAKPEEPKKVEPTAVPVRSPQPTMSEQKGSIAAMANKYQDNEEEDDDDDDETSSFEEISKPPQRAQPADPPRSAYAPKAQPAPVAASPVKTTPPAVKSPVGASTPTQPAVSASRAPAASGNVEGSLDQIKQLIENQTKLITAQNDKIGLLVNEVETLKAKVGSTSSSSAASQDQSERIRQLELELEEARS